MLMPMIEQAQPWSHEATLVTADAGYHSDARMQQRHDADIPALVADGQMRKRDERIEVRDDYQAKPDPLYDKQATAQGKQFQAKDFSFNDDNTAIPISRACDVVTMSGRRWALGGRMKCGISPGLRSTCRA